eukprot:6205698-Pleurochrysis_carterae.AAC.1
MESPDSFASLAPGWELYLSYMPGMAANYAKNPLKIAVIAGQLVSIKPPFVPAIRVRAANAPSPPAAATTGTLLGLLVGEEVWAAAETSSEQRSKPKSAEYRRFALVEVAGVSCFVHFDQLDSATDPSQPRAVLQSCVEKCCAATHERKAGS